MHKSLPMRMLALAAGGLLLAGCGGAGGKQGAAAPTTAAKGHIFVEKNCIKCHRISYYGIQGGEVGPDLSHAYSDVKVRFGVPLEEFLFKPKGTMAAVLSGMIHLTDDEKLEMIGLLKDADRGAPPQ